MPHIQPFNGRPTVFQNGAPLPLLAYSPIDYARRELAQAQTTRWFGHGLTAYFLNLPGVLDREDGRFFDSPFWEGDTISSEPNETADGTLDEQARFILASEPDARFIVRFGVHEPKSWRELHLDECFLTGAGEVFPYPSLASARYNADAARFAQTAIYYSQTLDWAGRIIGYANFLRMEGTHEPIIAGHLFDHSAPMLARWGGVSEEPLPREFEGVGLYFQGASKNGVLRAYFELQRDLFHEHFRGLCAAMDEARHDINRDFFLVYDALKIGMMGWNNLGFFDPRQSWRARWPEDRAGSGHLSVAKLFDARGFDGLITPHDYQARGLGGVYEPEGIADSCILRGKLFLCEMDTRTVAGNDVNFPARDEREFAAITWRNWATSWTRGFDSYPMDVYEDWFAPQFHPMLKRQIEVGREALTSWHHETVPGIAVILDDEAILETNGSGHVLNQHVMWEPKLGLARCGVPVRTYLLDDLALPNFPAHRVYYFPNLYRVDAARLELLRERVFKKGAVVVWGAGSGIARDGQIGVEGARELTGFEFEMLPINHPRRAVVSDFDHPLTRTLDAGDILGDSLAFGPVLFPKTGRVLARAWTSGGRDLAALAVLEHPGWHSVFAGVSPLAARFWREAARWAGAHIYYEADEIVLANSSLVALHSIQSGRKRLALPARFDVFDGQTGKEWARGADAIEFNLLAPETRLFHLQLPQ